MLVANVSELRKNLKKYIDSVSDDNEIVVVTSAGKSVVIISLDKYNEINNKENNVVKKNTKTKKWFQ